MNPPKLLLRMNAISRFAFFATIILLPFLFIPYFSINLGSIKGALLVIGLTISILAYAVARFVDGEVSYPKTRINLGLMLVLLTTTLSAFFSPAFYKSMFGLSFEVGSVASVLSLVLVYFLGIQYTGTERNHKRIIRTIFISFIASFVLVLFTYLTKNSVYNMSFIKGIINNTMVGSWTDYGVVSATVVLLAMCYSVFSTKGVLNKVFYWVVIAMGLLVMALVNIVSIWVITGVVALLFFVYSVALLHKPNQTNTPISKTIPITTFIIIVVCILFTLGNSFVGTFISSKVGFVSNYAQPSVKATLGIYKKQTSSNTLRTLVGYGPGRFAETWMQFKPLEINNTQYWDTGFTNGYGSVFTSLVTTGAVGFVAWLFFLFIYFVTGVRVLLAQFKTEKFDAPLVTTFFVSAFLWIVHFCIGTNVTVFVLTFITTAMFVGLLASKNIISVYKNTYLKDPRNSFFTILVLVCVMVGSIVGLYFSITKISSVIYFTKASQTNTAESALVYIQKAIKLENKNDMYYRTLSTIYTNQLNTLLSGNTKNAETEAQNLVTAIQNSSVVATTIDPANYSNWLNLGQFFEIATTLQIAGDPYTNGVAAYDKVGYYVPQSPAVPLAKARLELANKNIENATSFINKSLELKPDYVAAYQLKAQIAYNAKDFAGAVNNLSVAIKYNPNMADLYVSRGILLSQMGNNVDSVNDFRMAFSLTPNQSIGYMLAQADVKNGSIEEATTLVDALLRLSPENVDYKNLKEKIDQLNLPVPNIQQTDKNKKTNTKQ